jgi:hypothetical protein
LTMCLRPFCGHTMFLHINSYRGECAAPAASGANTAQIEA